MSSINGGLWNGANGLLNSLAPASVILSVLPHFTPFALFISRLYIGLAPPCIRAPRDLRWLGLIPSSPAFAGFDELLRGVTHVGLPSSASQPLER